MPYAKIRAVASYVPERIVDNNRLHSEYGFPKSAEWLEERTGIKSRSFAREEETPVSMARQVVERLLDRADARGQAIDLLIVTTYTGEVACPGTAVTVSDLAKLKVGLSFDLAAACAGFGAGLDVANRFIASGAQRAIVVSSEIHSRCLDFKDVRTAGLFGDGAAGVLLERASDPGIEASFASGMTGASHWLVRYNHHTPSSDSMPVREQAFFMPGNRELAESAVPFMTELGRGALAKAGIDIDAVRWVVPHQANARIVRALGLSIGASDAQMFMNVDRLGNCGSATVPLGVAELVDRGSVLPGDRVLCISAGAGVTGIAHVIRF